MKQNAPWALHQQQLDHFADAAPNFDREAVLTHFAQHTALQGWTIDRYKQELPAEPPGPPRPEGSFHTACNILKAYEFPDPHIITGIYVPDTPLKDRVMLLRARFLIFTFWLGVRVGRLIDETRNLNNETVQVWGYSYYTLEGHFEMGEMSFEIWKYLDTGKIEFHIHAFSQKGHIQNWFYRLGFWLFGRWIQVRFAKRALLRMNRLVQERMTKP
jgi:uncharacterized protein (UPF0548 family)